MAVPFSNTKLRVPRGFQNVLLVFAREVMRDDPHNIHHFGHSFFKTLLSIRASTGHDPAVHGAHSEDRFYNNWAYKESSKKHGGQDASGPASKSAEEEEIDIDLDDPAVQDAAVKIQAQFKGFSARKQLRSQRSLDQDKAEAEAAEKKKEEEEEEEIDIDLTDPAVEDAAVKIQAQFKGFKTRKALEETAASPGNQTEEKGSVPDKEEKETVPDKAAEEEEEIDIDLDDPAVQDAAVKIQAQFKGFSARKQLDKDKKGDA